jgi:hypothetical protein
MPRDFDRRYKKFPKYRNPFNISLLVWLKSYALDRLTQSRFKPAGGYPS